MGGSVFSHLLTLSTFAISLVTIILGGSLLDVHPVSLLCSMPGLLVYVIPIPVLLMSFIMIASYLKTRLLSFLIPAILLLLPIIWFPLLFILSILRLHNLWGV